MLEEKTQADKTKSVYFNTKKRFDSFVKRRCLEEESLFVKMQQYILYCRDVLHLKKTTMRSIQSTIHYYYLYEKDGCQLQEEERKELVNLIKEFTH